VSGDRLAQPCKRIARFEQVPPCMKHRIFVSSYLIMILIMFVLPFYTADGYSVVRHTTSQLGAQQTPNSWIMNLTFVMMGIASIYAGWSHYGKYWFHKVVLSIFGVSLLLTAVFSHSPINYDVNFSVREDELHSLFASSTGFSFCILAISTGLIKKKNSAKILPVLIGIAATLLSIMMLEVEMYKGIWQRLIFIISFGWMIYEFKE